MGVYDSDCRDANGHLIISLHAAIGPLLSLYVFDGMDAASYAKRILAKADDFYPQLVTALEKYRGQGLWIHFSDIPKIGIRTDISHKDPVGIYFFPLDHMASDFGKYHHWAFRRYIFVCRVSADNILDLSAVTQADMESMLTTAGIETYDRPERGLPGKRLWRALDEAATRGGRQWGTKRGMAFRRLLKGLGYDAVRDPGTGAIHGSEPDQLLVLDPTDIEVVEMVETTTKPYDADAYYRDHKYPFHGRSTKPALEVLQALASMLGLKPGRVTSRGKGSWAMSASDAVGNEIRLAEELHTSGAADYVSFRAKLSASWYSDGIQVYETGADPHGLEFDIHSDYADIVSLFATQLRDRMTETPLDDTSKVEEPLRGIADAIGGAKMSLESPVRGTLTKRIGDSELRVSLGFEHPESSYRAEKPSYSVTGVVKLPKVQRWSDQYAIDPDFGQDIELLPASTVVRDVVTGLPKWIRRVMEKHFPEGDARYDHIRRHTAPVLEFLEARNVPAKVAVYHRILSYFGRPENFDARIIKHETCER